MQPAAKPSNEEARLAVLRAYAILDTPREQAFDDIAFLASEICGTPISLVSLVDADRQWFKARVGVDAEETPRDVAFCAHAIHEEDLFIVPDAHEDARFRDNPLVTTNPKIRFYAGAPLVTSDGLALGALCVNDRVPRTLTAAQKQALRSLGRMVMLQLELRKNVEELRKARADAEAATVAKSAFLATMSHEIRTPLNAVIGMTSLLQATPLDEDQADFVRTIRTSGDHLLTVINDILDFSKIESGKMGLEQSPFDLRRCIEGAVDLVTQRAAEKGLELTCLIEPEVPAGIAGDEGRLRQVLVNLLGNAVKFTQRGEVGLAVSGRRIDAQHFALEFSIRDTGIGIPQDRVGRLFQAFSQADASTTRTHGGTGLGLAISKRLVTLMGGNISVQSQEGKGSTFRFGFAAPVAPTRVSVGATPEAFAGRRVLIVDDNATNRRILALYAKSWGMMPRDTADPHEALAWVRRGDPFDVAFLDLAMPGMDGVSLALALRQALGPATLPMLLLSSIGPTREAARAGGVEFAAHLTKPIKPSQLHDALVDVLSGVPRGKEPPEVAEIPVGLGKEHPLRVLLAEDNAVNQRVALKMLQCLGYSADVAANGLEVLAALQRQSYDVILMDVQMPEMDGLEASRSICRSRPPGARPRIVAMTANALNGDRDECLSAGMDDYVSKPVDMPDLVAALRKCRPVSSGVAV